MTSPQTSSDASPQVSESTRDSANGHGELRIPLPPTAQIDQTTVQMGFSVLMGLLSLGMHLWNRHKEK